MSSIARDLRRQLRQRVKYSLPIRFAGIITGTRIVACLRGRCRMHYGELRAEQKSTHRNWRSRLPIRVVGFNVATLVMWSGAPWACDLCRVTVLDTT